LDGRRSVKVGSDRGDHRGVEPLAQPPLGALLARPPVLDRQAVGVEIVGDQVGTGTAHVRGICLEPQDNLLQLRD